jgi:hypothetical protein
VLPNAVSIIHVDKNIIRIESLNDGTSKNEMKTENIEKKIVFLYIYDFIYIVISQKLCEYSKL